MNDEINQARERTVGLIYTIVVIVGFLVLIALIWYTEANRVTLDFQKKASADPKCTCPCHTKDRTK